MTASDPEQSVMQAELDDNYLVGCSHRRVPRGRWGRIFILRCVFCHGLHIFRHGRFRIQVIDPRAKKRRQGRTPSFAHACTADTGWFSNQTVTR